MPPPARLLDAATDDGGPFAPGGRALERVPLEAEWGTEDERAAPEPV
jgi:hypothetical protein